jgi:DNA polymerase III alpha subunit (gram-positive type)
LKGKIMGLTLGIIDYETTGLDPTYLEEPIELHIQLWTPEAGLSLDPAHSFYRLWLPQGPVHPKAQAANKYDYDTWVARGARYMVVQDMYDLSTWLAGNKIDMWCGCNVGFDLDFFKHMYRRVRAVAPDVGHRKVDVQTLGALLMFTGELKKCSLEAMAEHLGIVNPAPHTSPGDVWTTAQVLERFAARFLRM